jgi:hypothetical protein
VGTNSNTLNVSDIVASSTAEVAFPLNYTLTISSLLVVKRQLYLLNQYFVIFKESLQTETAQMIILI